MLALLCFRVATEFSSMGLLYLFYAVASVGSCVAWPGRSWRAPAELSVIDSVDVKTQPIHADVFCRHPGPTDAQAQPPSPSEAGSFSLLRANAPRPSSPSALRFFPQKKLYLAAYVVQAEGGSVAEWLACWTQAQKGPGSNRSRDAVG